MINALSTHMPSRRVPLITAVMVGFLILFFTNYFVLNQQRNRMLEDNRALADVQMTHLVEETKSSLQDGNYQSVDRFLTNWGQTFIDVVSVKLITKNGSILSEFSRDIPGDRHIKLEQEISYSYKGKARLILVKGLGSVDREMEKFFWQLFAISLVALTVFGVLVNEILQRRQMELNIRKNNDELEQHINERTEQLRHEVEVRKSIEKNLLIAKDSAEDATKAKSDFLANMSHELRTPLNAILGYTESIRMETFGPINNEKYDEYLGIIYSSGDHLLCLINEILDISAIEAGKLELSEENVDLPALIESTVELLDPRASKKDIQVSYIYNGEPLGLLCDKRRMKQIVLNLLSNAIRYTPDAGRVEIKTGLDKQNAIWFSISDTGVGMSAPEIDIAMEKFGQVDSSITNVNKGTGLGLPLVKSLVEIHGGSLAIDSEPGVGTTVTVRFSSSRTIHAA